MSCGPSCGGSRDPRLGSVRDRRSPGHVGQSLRVSTFAFLVGYQRPGPASSASDQWGEAGFLQVGPTGRSCLLGRPRLPEVGLLGWLLQGAGPSSELTACIFSLCAYDVAGEVTSSQSFKGVKVAPGSVKA